MWATVREWYLPAATDDELEAALTGLRAVEGWPDAAYDGSRRHLAALKNLTSDVIGRYCGAVQDATYAAAARAVRPVRRRPGRAPGDEARARSRCSRAFAAHYVMRADDRVALMSRQRELLAELVAAARRGAARQALDTPYADN